MLFGELVLWDLPCAIWIKALRRPDLPEAVAALREGERAVLHEHPHARASG